MEETSEKENHSYNHASPGWPIGRRRNIRRYPRP